MRRSRVRDRARNGPVRALPLSALSQGLRIRVRGGPGGSGPRLPAALRRGSHSELRGAHPRASASLSRGVLLPLRVPGSRPSSERGVVRNPSRPPGRRPRAPSRPAHLRRMQESVVRDLGLTAPAHQAGARRAATAGTLNPDGAQSSHRSLRGPGGLGRVLSATRAHPDRAQPSRHARFECPVGGATCLFHAGENRRNPPWRMPETG